MSGPGLPQFDGHDLSDVHLYVITFFGRRYVVSQREADAYAEQYGPEVVAGCMTADRAAYEFLTGLGFDLAVVVSEHTREAFEAEMKHQAAKP